MKHPRPWYRKEKDAWFICYQGKQHRLAKGKKNRKIAVQKAYAILGETAPALPAHIRIENVIDRWDADHKKLASYKWAMDFLNDFKTKYGRLRLTHLKRGHLRKWSERESWSDTTKNKAIGCVQTAINYCVDQEMIPFNPIKGMKKPQCSRRERLPTPEERRKILSVVHGPFKRYLYALANSGARPGEIARITGSHFSEQHACLILPPRRHKTGKRTGRPRIIYLSEPMVKLCKLQLKRYPEGPLFRSAKLDRPWTKNAIRCRFRRLRAAFPELKGIVAYCYRHGFVTEALEKGIGDATVAELVGHANTATIHRYYSHLTEKGNHLRAAMKKATALPRTTEETQQKPLGDGGKQ